MADEQTQQTRVLLLNDRTIILQGDADDNSINDINADLLQQALQEVSAPVTGVEEPHVPDDSDYNASIPGRNESNLVAIFQGEEGETHTVQLTVEQAEALGLHFSAEDPDKQCVSVLNPSTPSTFAVASEGSHLVYSDNSIAETESKSLFNSCVGTEVPTVSLQNDGNLQDENSALQPPLGMGVLSEVGSYVENQNNITLIPQFVNGQMTYTVKLNPPEHILQDQEYHVIKDESDVTNNDKNTVSLLAPMHDVSLSGSPVSNSSASSLNSTSLPHPLNSSSFTQTHLNNVHSGISTLPAVSTVLCPTASSNIYQNSKTNTINTPVDKPSKQSYVLVPGNSANSMSLLTKTSPTQLMRPGKQLPQSTKLVSSAASHIPSAATLTGIPIMNSNINITRTSPSGSGLVPSVSTTLTGGGMIRVVAGGTNTNMQTASSNNPKFTNILTPSGRLVAATSGTTTSTQRVISLTTTADSLKSTSSVVATSMSTIPATSTSQSAAVTNVPSNSASAMSRVNINSSKPLGSSENPIQLVQHGQTFHSVQALSQEQLRQIATVLQQQHLDSAPRTKNVLYDAETNTRIIYRVVYPEDLDLRESTPTNSGGTGSGVNSNSNTGVASATANSSSSSKLHLSSTTLVTGGRGRGRRGRPRGRGRPPLHLSSHDSPTAASLARKHSADLDLDEDLLAHDPSKIERRKQLQLARTRSGRLSRPPRHMVKDYKRLHYLDFADADVDDSDGGYSDYQTSDREPEDLGTLVLAGAVIKTEQGAAGVVEAAAGAGAQAAAGIGTGAAGLLRLDAAAPPLPQPTVPKRKIPSHFRCPTCQKVYLGHSRMARHFEMFPDHGSIEQIKTRSTSVPMLPPPPSVPDTKSSSSPTVNGIMRGGPVRRRGKRRGPWNVTPEVRSERRKIKLREVLGVCEAAELAEVAGPAVARGLSLWELLLLRVEAVRTEESLVATLCDELRSLLDRVQAVASEVLQPANSDPGGKEEHLELQDELLSQALGLPCGRYQVVDEYLLSSRRHRAMEPPSKRPRPSPARSPTPSPCSSPIASDRPACPEVLSALALDPKPPPASQPQSSPPQLSEPMASPEPPGSPNLPSAERSKQLLLTDSGQAAVADSVSVTDHFLLPECTPAPLSPTEASVSEVQTVDDIVNERLEKLTGFSVRGTLGRLGSTAAASLSPGASCNRHTPADTRHSEVSAFDPELALAAMGEGDQPGSVAAFEPELALVAMGEGDPAQVGSRQHSPAIPTAGTTSCSEAATFDPELALAAMGEGGDDAGPADGASFDAEMALAAMGEPAPVTRPGAGSDCEAPRSETSFALTGMDVSLDESATDLDFEALSAEFGQPVSQR